MIANETTINLTLNDMNLLSSILKGSIFVKNIIKQRYRAYSSYTNAQLIF